MKSVIVGTAGHIDHGKTALVKALTGIDADRLEEEKRRGITIDLGFANLDLAAPDGERLRLGFIDVPGHERFVRNMLAGVGGIDIVLLVIAADEGIKPQTREHFDICRLLHIPRGIVALTKSDTVDAETLDVVRLEVEEFLRGSFLDPARTPIVPVSALRGDGIESLRHTLAEAASGAATRSGDAIARLPIDRAFTMKGFGAVVTGTLISGRIRREDELELHPAGRCVRVRGVQIHGAAADEARAGERTAINLAGVAVEELARGMMLTNPNTLRPVRALDVRLQLLKDAKPLKHLARVHLHAYASETLAQVRLLEGKELAPGGSALAQLRTAQPLVLAPGDRFIIRQFSPAITIGGGAVLDAAPLRRTSRDSTAAAEWLRSVETTAPEEALAKRIQRRSIAGFLKADAVRETGLSPQTIDALAQQLVAAKTIVAAGDLLITSAAVAAAEDSLLKQLEAFHKANPLVPGLAKETLREKTGLGPEVFASLLAQLVAKKKVEASGDTVRLPGRGVSMTDDERRARNTIEAAFSSAGLKAPALAEVLSSLRIDKARSQKIVTLLLREGVLVKLGDDLVFHRDALHAMRNSLVAEKQRSRTIDVARFKDLTGVSRKYAIPLLEYLDRERVTRRVGDSREIL